VSRSQDQQWRAFEQGKKVLHTKLSGRHTADVHSVDAWCRDKEQHLQKRHTFQVRPTSICCSQQRGPT
jgi:hypothetical protein